MLSLGKSFNRNYNLRIPFFGGFYNIGIFFNDNSTFLLFSVNSDFSESKHNLADNIKVNMFKNIESSKFCETFLNLHNYQGVNLDIINQFKEIKPDFTTDISFLLNETIIVKKINVEDKVFYDQIYLYGFTLPSYSNEFIYLLAERHSISQKINKKIVRTSSLQISSNRALSLLDDYNSELKNSISLFKNNNISQEDITL
jgi:hypothetical protein